MKEVLSFKPLLNIRELELKISNLKSNSNMVIEEKRENLIAKPPVVVVVGHIDHGKTTLLDRIRQTSIAEKESGGITQHIGAYEAEHHGKKITFIDTPGHEAFSAMRSRGAKVADIAILVVAANEGVKAQTKEAISHIKMAQIPIIVALNKIDLPQAEPERVKGELEKAGIKLESRGGDIPLVEVSAKTGQGIQDLLELILLVAEMENLKADLAKPASGVVIETYLDPKRGPTATLLLQDGKLKKEDIINTASTYGVVRILEDFQGRPLKEALPSQPVVVVGFEEVPLLGERFEVCQTIEEAQKKIIKKKIEGIGQTITSEPDKKILNLILKADVSGSLEAIDSVLKSLPQEKVIIRILKKEVGEINEKDIKLAKIGKAKILAFRTKPDAISKKLAAREGITILTFNIIYELVQAVRTLMEKQLAPEVLRENLGELRVLVIFKREKNRQIIGGRIMKGEAIKGALIEVFRGEEKIGQGKLVNLQKQKRDIEKGVKGDEIGILYEGSGQIEKDDILILYKEEKRKIEL